MIKRVVEPGENFIDMVGTPKGRNSRASAAVKTLIVVDQGVACFYPVKKVGIDEAYVYMNDINLDVHRLILTHFMNGSPIIQGAAYLDV